MKKIELNILSIMIFEGVFLLLFFNTSFMNIILGTILGIILIIITRNIKKNNIINLILFVILIPIFIIILLKITNFITYNILINYSFIPISISIILISYYLSRKYHTFIKTIELFFYIILFIKIIKLLLLIPLINFNNITFDFSIDYHLLLISLIIFLIYIYFFYYNDYKLSKSNIVISIINPSITKLMALLILGSPLTNIYKYPYINYLKNIKYLDFIERVDGLLSFEYILVFITLLSYILLIIKSKIKSHQNGH